MRPYYEDTASGITIYHGDCRDVLPFIGVGCADLALTDPPYGVGFTYTDRYVDDHDGYQPMVLAAFEQMRRISPLVMLTTGVRNLWLYPQPTWVLCWAKPGSPRRNGLGGFNEWEPVAVYGKRRIYNDFKYLPAWSNISDGHGDHPCPKPLALCRWLISVGSDEGATVLDPFMGSGTTLRAAKDLGRRAIGIDIEERYCEIAAKRLSQGVLFSEAPT